MKIQRVDLSSIDLENGKYRVGQSLYSKDLTNSLKKVGQINPITLVVENDKYIVVNGWKRMEALIEAGETFVYANVLGEAEFSNLELMLLNYFDNRQRYTELDKASMLDKVRELCSFNDDELLPILEVLSIKPSLNNLRKYLSVASLPPEFKELFYSDYFTFEQLVLISDIKDLDYRNALFNRLLKPYRFNTNELRELIREIYEISKRDNLSYDECIDNIFSNTGENTNKNEIKKTIRFLRYPDLVEVEKEFKQRLKAIEDTPDLEINHHPFFETNRVEVKFKVRDLNQFRESMKRLNEDDIEPIIETLLKLIKQGK